MQKRDPIPGDPAGTAGEINQTFDTQLGPVTECYRAELERSKWAEGAVQIRFVIRPDGRVSATEILDNSLSEELGRCVLAGVAEMTFDPLAERALVTKTVRFGLSESAPAR